MLRSITAYGLLFTFSVVFLYIFIRLWFVGPLELFESNLFVRSIETALIVFAVVLSIERLSHFLRSFRR